MAATRSPRARWRGRRILLMVVLLLAVATGAVGAALYHHHVVAEPGPHLARSHIRSIIAQESPVYYRDGQTRIGVFFEDEHRATVRWDELPPAWVASIVAAEDARFWSHAGFDVWHIGRAMKDNLSAGRLVAGGSTLTQQTAKNLYYRPDRSLREKLIEGLNALRLEHHYDKSEILTFYANQFHVSGNGRGIGIAARHLFDKDVAGLSVLESAFIAGMVKAPSYYDPFTGSEERRVRALAKAHDRTNYVLRRLLEVDPHDLAGPLPGWGADAAEQAAFERRVAEVHGIQAEAKRLLDEGFELPFSRGTFRFDSSAVLDEVARRLSEPPFDRVLAAAGVEDPSTAGLRVITTLDPEAQRAATYALWHHLTEVGVMLETKGVSDFLREDVKGPVHDPNDPPRIWEFRLARVTAAAEDEGRRALQVDLGGHECLVDRDAIVRASVVVRRGEARSASAKIPTADVDAFVEALPVGSVVWVSVREVREDGLRCDLELRPELQGAAVALVDGEVRAMVGGNDNRNFNRVEAPRQLGSTWKPLIYHAAMQLGWSPDDRLDNRRGVFPFSATFYYPRPDHTPEPEVSLAWAGVRSENVASVWLLYHLMDRLDAEQLAAVAQDLGLARQPDEDRGAYMLRIQKDGVLPTPSRVREALFLSARDEVLRSAISLRHPEDAVSLRSLLYGWGFAAERRRTRDRRHLDALAHSWVELEPLREACAESYRALRDALEIGVIPMATNPALHVRREGDRLEVACGAAPEGFGSLTEAMLEEPEEEVLEEIPEVMPRRRTLRRLRIADEVDMWVGGRLRADTLDAVMSAFERRRLQREVAGDGAADLYDPSLLYWHQDFRTLMALRYVKRMAERYGVGTTEIREVLSMPLGASEITLEEAAKVYETMLTGKSWEFPGVGGAPAALSEVGVPAAPTLLISEIQDVDGQVLYRARPRSVEVAPTHTAEMTVDVLRNVVRWGTGRRARDVVTVGGSSVAVAGKTGTTNDFRNAAFLGVVPTIRDGQLDAGHVWTLAVYVGYDDNRPMVNGRIKLDGAKGALPAWIGMAKGIAAAGKLGGPDRAPAGGWTWPDSEGLVRMPVDPDLGGTVVAAGSGSGATVLTRPRAPSVVLQTRGDLFERVQRPVRIEPRRANVNAGRNNGDVWTPLKKKLQQQPPG